MSTFNAELVKNINIYLPYGDNILHYIISWLPNFYSEVSVFDDNLFNDNRKQILFNKIKNHELPLGVSEKTPQLIELTLKYIHKGLAQRYYRLAYADSFWDFNFDYADTSSPESVYKKIANFTDISLHSLPELIEECLALGVGASAPNDCGVSPVEVMAAKMPYVLGLSSYAQYDKHIPASDFQKSFELLFLSLPNNEKNRLFPKIINELIFACSNRYRDMNDFGYKSWESGLHQMKIYLSTSIGYFYSRLIEMYIKSGIYIDTKNIRITGTTSLYEYLIGNINISDERMDKLHGNDFANICKNKKQMLLSYMERVEIEMELLGVQRNSGSLGVQNPPIKKV